MEVDRNAIDLIKRRPTMFFAAVPVRPAELISAILKDVSEAMATSVTASCSESGGEVYADVDWMDEAGHGVADLFSKFATPRIMQANSFRSEVLIGATCDRIFTFGTAGTFAHGFEPSHATPIPKLKFVPKRGIAFQLRLEV